MSTLAMVVTRLLASAVLPLATFFEAVRPGLPGVTPAVTSPSPQFRQVRKPSRSRGLSLLRRRLSHRYFIINRGSNSPADPSSTQSTIGE
jgi:hypothetical protein